MGKYYENHRESPHRIDVYNPLFRHFACKNTEKNWNFWIIGTKILLLHYERTNKLDRLGEGTGGLLCRLLSLSPIARVILLQVFAGRYHRYLLFSLRLAEERQRLQQSELAEILAWADTALFII